MTSPAAPAAPAPTPSAAGNGAGDPSPAQDWWVLVLRGKVVAYMQRWVSPKRPDCPGEGYWLPWSGRAPELGDEPKGD